VVPVPGDQGPAQARLGLGEEGLEPGHRLHDVHLTIESTEGPVLATSTSKLRCSVTPTATRQRNFGSGG
jgi:hypothetical protein